MQSAQRVRVLAILLALLSPLLFAGSTGIRFDEAETRDAVISEKKVVLVVPVSNDSGAHVSGTFCVELLDSQDAVVAASRSPERLTPGQNSINSHWMRPPVVSPSEQDPVLWTGTTNARVVKDCR